jgi:CBS domain-containing protein
MKARDLMTGDQVWTCTEATTIAQAARMMAEHDVGALPILDNFGRLSGIVTDRDICCKAVGQGKQLETPVTEIMSRPVHSVHPDADLREIERLMQQYRVRRVPVVDDQQQLIGFISLADMARKAHGILKEHSLAQTLELVSQP